MNIREQSVRAGVFSALLGECEVLPGIRLVRAVAMRDSFRRHSHASILVGIVSRGWRRFRMQQGELLIESGNGFVLPAQMAHTCEVSSDHGYRVVIIAPSLWREITCADGPVVAEIVPGETSVFLAIRRLVVALRSRPETLCVETCVAELQKSLVQDGALGGAGESDELPERVRDVCAWLEEHCTETVRLTTLAELAGCSPGLINRLFRQVSGLPPYEYLTQLRLRFAAARLRDSEVPLSDIALAAGFSDQSHFQRFFRRAYGITPKAYRESSLVLKRS